MKQDLSILERLFSLRGKSVLVTGAAGGIGRVLAVAMAEAGARLALHDVALEHLADPCQAVRDVGGETFPLAANLLDVEACRGLITNAHAALGRLDVLVNCAGVNR